MKKNLQKGLSAQAGFTLIELLVVIAIIGILASVILASLNSARAKGTDAAVKSDLENARPQAEIYYDAKNGTYAGVCSTATSATPGGIQTMLADAASKNNTTYSTAFAAAGSATLTMCHDNAAGWAVSAPMKSTTGNNQYWCVDSTGKAEGISTTGGPANLAGSAITCP